MNESRPVQSLPCSTQAALLNACVTEADLRQLGIWKEAPSRLGFSPAVWCRAFLHRALQADGSTARRLTDLLDLQYLDTTMLVRCMGVADVEALVDRWVQRPTGHALPGLLWALCTDARDEVHGHGVRLCHEAVTTAFRRLVDDPSPAPSGN